MKKVILASLLGLSFNVQAAYNCAVYTGGAANPEKIDQLFVIKQGVQFTAKGETIMLDESNGLAFNLDSNGERILIWSFNRNSSAAATLAFASIDAKTIGLVDSANHRSVVCSKVEVPDSHSSVGSKFQSTDYVSHPGEGGGSPSRPEAPKPSTGCKIISCAY